MRKTRLSLFCMGAFLWASAPAGVMAAEQTLKALPKGAVPIPSDVFNFDRDAAGKPPTGFTLVVAGSGPQFQWLVRPDHLAPSKPNVLAQAGAAEPGENFALALLDGRAPQNGEEAVQFKITGGEENQAAGLIWRYQDPQTYYVAVADSKEDYCSIYRIKKGKRKLLTNGSSIISPYTWHELRLVFVNNNYSAFIDGELVAAGKDSSFLKAGRVGLWTPGDSTAQFDDFRLSK